MNKRTPFDKHLKNPALSIPFGKGIGGLFAGLFFAITFYLFLYVFRELCGLIFSLLPDQPFLILPWEVTHMHTLFLAFLSIIFGQSICFSIWLQPAVNKYGKAGLKYRTAVHDQFFMNALFLFWFSRLFTIVLLMVGDLFVFANYPGLLTIYHCILLLAIPMLFLYSWTTLRRFLPNNTRWMCISALAVTLLSVILSFVDPIGSERNTRLMTEKNIWNNTQIELPVAENYEWSDSYYSRVGTILLEKPEEPLVILNRHGDFAPLDWEDSHWYNDYRYTVYPHGYVLHIDKSMPMKYVNGLKRELYNRLIIPIHHTVIPKYNQSGLYKNQYSYQADTSTGIVDPEAWEKEEESFLYDFYQPVKIRRFNRNQFLFDHDTIPAERWKETVADFIAANPYYAFIYYIDDDQTYQEYIDVVTGIKEIIIQSRENYAREHLQEDDDLYYRKYNEIKEQFPFRIHEVAVK